MDYRLRSGRRPSSSPPAGPVVSAGEAANTSSTWTGPSPGTRCCRTTMLAAHDTWASSIGCPHLLIREAVDARNNNVSRQASAPALTTSGRSSPTLPAGAAFWSTPLRPGSLHSGGRGSRPARLISGSSQRTGSEASPRRQRKWLKATAQRSMWWAEGGPIVGH